MRTRSSREGLGRFGYLPVSPGMTLNEIAVRRILADYAPGLHRLGGECRTVEQLAQPAPLFYFLVSGGTEHEVLRLHRERSGLANDEPVFLLAHPGNNSLPAALEVLARLQQDGAAGRILFLKGERDPEGYRRVADAVRDLEVRRKLRRTRIGCVGEPSDWLVASTPSPAVVEQVWGPEVVAIDLRGVEEMIYAVSQEAVSAHMHLVSDRTPETNGSSQAYLEKALRVYLGLKRAVEQYDLDALTVRCFELVLDMRTTACLALAQLNDEGTIAGCEGDLVSAVGLMWAQELVGTTPWMANPAQLDATRNSLRLAHCTVPRSIVEHWTLRTHFESQLGVAIQGHLPPGPVTLLRIGGRSMDRLWLAEGEIVQAGFAENLCRTQAEIRLSGGHDVRDLLRVPLGNHLVMVSGHHLTKLEDWHRTMLAVAQAG